MGEACLLLTAHMLGCLNNQYQAGMPSGLPHLHVPHNAQELQDADEVPGGVKLPPLQTVAGRVGELQGTAHHSIP